VTAARAIARLAIIGLSVAMEATRDTRLCKRSGVHLTRYSSDGHLWLPAIGGISACPAGSSQMKLTPASASQKGGDPVVALTRSSRLSPAMSGGWGEAAAQTCCGLLVTQLGSGECIAAGYWIASSAVANNVSGMVTPSALAVLTLMTSSTRVDCCTGSSAGFSPLRIRPV
jgi:hypothetical protein